MESHNTTRKATKSNRSDPNIKCIHVFAEANWVADALSKHSHQTTIPQVYFNSKQMPKEAKAYDHP